VPWQLTSYKYNSQGCSAELDLPSEHGSAVVISALQVTNPTFGDRNFLVVLDKFVLGLAIAVYLSHHLSPVARRAASSASNSSRHSPQIST
jgi:hypothetical protein